MSATPASNKPPTAIPVLGVFAVVVAAVSLCAAAWRMIQPESGLPVAAADRLLEDQVVYVFIVVGLAVLSVVSIVLVVAAVGLILGKYWGRTLALFWCWGTLGIEAANVIIHAILIGGRAGNAEIGAPYAVLSALSVPTTGCCVSLFALIALVVLYHDRIRAWAATATPSHPVAAPPAAEG